MRTFIQTSAAVLFALLVLAAGAAAQQQQGSGSSQPSVSVTMQTPAVAAQDNVPGDGARRIAPAEVRAALDSGKAVIVDVRGQNSYEAGHVKGALFIPFSDILSRVDELPRDKMVITYCS